MHSLPQISYTRNWRYRPADKAQPILSLSLHSKSWCTAVSRVYSWSLAKPTEPEFTRNRNPTVLELTWCGIGGAHHYTVVVPCSADARCAQQRASGAVRDRRRESMYSNLQQVANGTMLDLSKFFTFLWEEHSYTIVLVLLYMSVRSWVDLLVRTPRIVECIL